jgi:predicted dehydrogenase
MKYEFHVGDYVETIGGWVGWITTVRKDGWILVIGTNGSSCSYLMPNEQRFFRRIGQYDFTKKDDGKIEPLACETANDYSNKKLRKKINELVEAVNRLEEKVNEMVH